MFARCKADLIVMWERRQPSSWEEMLLLSQGSAEFGVGDRWQGNSCASKEHEIYGDTSQVG